MTVVTKATQLQHVRMCIANVVLAAHTQYTIHFVKDQARHFLNKKSLSKSRLLYALHMITWANTAQTVKCLLAKAKQRGDTRRCQSTSYSYS